MPSNDAQREQDREWSQNIAVLVVDSLIDAKLVAQADFARAVEIAAEEINVRLALHDRPT